MEIVHTDLPVRGRVRAIPLIERIAPGSGRRIAALRRPRRGSVRDLPSLGPESARRVGAMLSLLPGDCAPRGLAEEQAARDLEPVHASLVAILGPGRNPFRSLSPGGWIAYRDNACEAAGLPPSALRFLPGRMSEVSDALARSLEPSLAPSFDVDDILPYLRTAAARLLWGHRDLIESIHVLRLAEASSPRDPAAHWLPRRLAELDAEGWERALRREVGSLHPDPGAWVPPAP